MGYNHYWKREPAIDPIVFAKIVADFQRIVLPLNDKGVALAGPLGDGAPKITEEGVALNGISACGHPENEEIQIPHPDESAWGIGDSSNAVSGHAFLHTLLRHRACNGNCSYESFIFDRICEKSPGDDEPYCSEYCKTGFRPYDLAVQCFLLVAKHHLRDRVMVTSGGTDKQWEEAKAFCYTHLGYPLFEFRMDQERGLVEI